LFGKNSVEVNFVLADNKTMSNLLTIASKTFQSRLLIGTGKFASAQLMLNAIEASETELVTMAIRRVNPNNPEDGFMDLFKRRHLQFLPNTSGARNAEEAVRIAKIGQVLSGSNWVKLEVTPEPNYLLPDPIETLKAAEQLVKEGFVVLPYMGADPILAKHLQEVGCATVMPLAAPIGSNLGLKTKEFIQIIIEQATVPVVVDAGLGAPSDAAQAMELGADAVLINTAIATAENPIGYAKAFKWAVQAGRLAYESGIPTQSLKAEASSPLTGFLHS